MKFILTNRYTSNYIYKYNNENLSGHLRLILHLEENYPNFKIGRFHDKVLNIIKNIPNYYDYYGSNSNDIEFYSDSYWCLIEYILLLCMNQFAKNKHIEGLEYIHKIYCIMCDYDYYYDDKMILSSFGTYNPKIEDSIIYNFFENDLIIDHYKYIKRFERIDQDDYRIMTSLLTYLIKTHQKSDQLIKIFKKKGNETIYEYEHRSIVKVLKNLKKDF